MKTFVLALIFAVFAFSLAGCFEQTTKALPPVSSSNAPTDPADEPPVSGGQVILNTQTNPVITYTGTGNE